MDLVEFLLARIAEDERNARQRIQSGEGRGVRPVNPTPARVLAECKVKRDLVDGFGDDYVTRVIATIYADHADYREGWKP